MHVSTYKILVNDDLKIEFKIVSPIHMYVLVTHLAFFFKLLILMQLADFNRLFFLVCPVTFLVYLISKHNRHPLPILLW